MTYRGKVQNGVVVFDDSGPPEGTVVQVQPVTPMAEGKGVWGKLLKLAGRGEHLPPDAARQHDHYLYGLPKR